jgi:molybdopterin synthase catalytic subunit
MEMIKTTVPVWKREHRSDGARWVDARHGDVHEDAPA